MLDKSEIFVGCGRHYASPTADKSAFRPMCNGCLASSFENLIDALNALLPSPSADMVEAIGDLSSVTEAMDQARAGVESALETIGRQQKSPED